MRLVYGDLDLTDAPFLIEEGTDTGGPQNEVLALAFLLQDGEVELSSRASNRTVVFNVLIEGVDLADLAASEAALVAETEKPLNTLSLDPEDFGPVSVFEVFRGQVTLQRDDSFERARLRRYQVTVRALPFVRSADEVVAVAVATGTTTTNVDTAGSTTGWTGYIDNDAPVSVVLTTGPPTTLSVTTAPVTGGPRVVSMVKTVSLDTSSLKYLVVDWSREARHEGLSQRPLEAIADGVTLSRLAESGSPISGGFARTWFEVSADSIGELRLRASSFYGGTSSLARNLTIDNIAISDVRPYVGSPHQQIRAVAVEGSARSQMAIAVESESAALGDTLVYVYPDGPAYAGYVPALRAYRSAGGSVTASSGYVSGGFENISGSGVTYQIPLALLPRTMHLLMVRVNTFLGGGGTTLTWTAHTTVGGVDLDTTTGTFAVPSTTGYENFAVARLILPTTDVSESTTGVVTLNLKSSSTCYLDEAWLFSSIGQLTQVSCGTGTAASGGPANRLFLEPATVSTPRPTVRAGFAADGSDAYFPDVKAWQIPACEPPSFQVLTCTSNATDCVLTARYFPRWHTHAAS